MNCWPGCIARVVTEGPAKGCWVLTKYQSLIAAKVVGEPAWSIELLSAASTIGAVSGARIFRSPGYQLAFCRDSDLRPIPPDELKGFEVGEVDKPVDVGYLEGV